MFKRPVLQTPQLRTLENMHTCMYGAWLYGFQDQGRYFHQDMHGNNLGTVRRKESARAAATASSNLQSSVLVLASYAALSWLGF